MNVYDVPQFGPLENRCYKERRVSLLAKKIRSLVGQANVLKFDPYACADVLGIRVREAELREGVDGKLNLTPFGATVTIAANSNPLRKRFTLCHEIAHLCFLTNTPALPHERGVNCSSVGQREESLCNEIAGELLMPCSAFVRHAKQLAPRFESLTALAHMFGVNISAVIIKVEKSGVWSVGRAIWELPTDQHQHGLELVVRTALGKGVRSYQRKDAHNRRIKKCLSATLSHLRNNPQLARRKLRPGRYVTFQMGDNEISLRRDIHTNKIRALVLI